jgi:hypothetical protein
MGKYFSLIRYHDYHDISAWDMSSFFYIWLLDVIVETMAH